MRKDYYDHIAFTSAACGIPVHYQRDPRTMKNLLLSIALFCIMGGIAESAEPEKIYVQPVPVFYSWVGGYTNFPQYPMHKPAYYVWPTIIIKEQPKKTMMLGDLPQYF